MTASTCIMCKDSAYWLAIGILFYVFRLQRFDLLLFRGIRGVQEQIPDEEMGHYMN